MRFALTIAGSDSSGAAGIQADTRAFEYLGIKTACSITAVTSQGPKGVDAVQLIDPDVISSQIANAFRSYDIATIKIGMLGSTAQVLAAAEALRKEERPYTVLDPVIRSTSGMQLLDRDGIEAMMHELLPMATVFTPNIDELAALTHREVRTETDRINAAKTLFSRGAKAVLVKGGHLETDPIDFLVLPDQAPICFEGDRVITNHGRGTGCALSSLIAGHLALGSDLYEAVRLAKSELQSALKNPVIPRRGRGYPFPSDHASHADRCEKLNGIYFVSDARLNPQITHAIGCRLALEGGASTVQLRAKEYEPSYLAKVAERIKRLSSRRKGLFIVNDSIEVALGADADGVHLGPDDLDPETARRILGPTKIIGTSVSTVAEAKRGAEFASYLAVGAIFGSSTKGDAGDAVGVERITEIKSAFPDKKIVAIGGINLSNIASVAAAGADAAAVVSAIVCAPDPAQATRELLAEFERGKAM